jgi:hypothetical protein
MERVSNQEVTRNVQRARGACVGRFGMRVAARLRAPRSEESPARCSVRRVRSTEGEGVEVERGG